MPLASHMLSLFRHSLSLLRHSLSLLRNIQREAWAWRTCSAYLISQGTNSSFINNLLGRTAHIALIEDLDFARCLVWGVIRR